MKKRFCVIACLIFACYDAYLCAQSNKITPVTPEAAALAKMVNYPVNLNTGVPNINIPFYTIKAGGLEMPITFDYNASGFKINERSTRMGLGWSLSTDIQITRTINGLDDFAPSKGYIANVLAKAYVPGQANYPFFEAPAPFTYKNAYDLAAGEKDGEPDKFNYKLLDKSGSFFFQKNASGTGYSIVTVPYDNIQITFNDYSFTIVDTDGTTYYFGDPGTGLDLGQALAHGQEVTGGISVPGACNDCKTTAWKCKRIVGNTGTDEITFTYANKAVSMYSSFLDRVEYYDNADPCGLGEYYKPDEPPLDGLSNYEQVALAAPFHKISSPKYMEVFGPSHAKFHLPYTDNLDNLLEKVYTKNDPVNSRITNVAGLSVASINFRGGTVVFNGVDQLASIQVLDKANNPVKEVYFYQSYTPATYQNDAKIYNGQDFQGTLYLDSLHMKGQGVTMERYALLYKNKFCFGDHLKGKDAWGYPNESTVELAYSNSTPFLAFPTKYHIQPKIFKGLELLVLIS